MRGKAFRASVIVLALLAVAVPAGADPDAFVDESSRIAFRPEAETLVTDAEFIDPDGDGDLDLVVARGGLDGVQDSSILSFLNDGNGNLLRGRFARAANGDFADIEFGDANDDGFLDAILSVTLGPERLLIWNPTRGRFQDRTRNLPSDQPDDVTLESRFFDADGDGDLDIVTANEDPFTAPGTQNRLYLNNGTGRFVDATTTNMPAILDDSSAIGVGDFDDDGDLDLLSVNAGRDVYLENDGSGVFSDQTASRLPAEPSNADSGRDVVEADFDGDGDLDLFLAVSRQDRSPVLWLNDGTGRFVDATATNVPAEPLSAQDVEGCDIEGDGDLDIVLSDTGAVLNPPTDHRFLGAPNHIYVNDGLGRFTDVSSGLLPQDAESTFSIACGDIDLDGDLDLVAANGKGEPMRVYVQT
ncbi:MAG: FG-GAP-like repeat-containing protein [Actinomycetota bacterium]